MQVLHVCERERERESVASPDEVNEDLKYLNSGQSAIDESRILHNASANMRAWIRDDIMGMELKVRSSDSKSSRLLAKRHGEIPSNTR